MATNQTTKTPTPALAPAPAKPTTPELLTIQGVIEPKALGARRRKPVPGLEDRFQVTRTGRVWSLKKNDWMKEGTEVLMTIGGKKVFAKTNYLVAITWLTEAQREEIRGICKQTPRDLWFARCKELAPVFSVGSYAISWVGLMAASEFHAVQVAQGGPVGKAQSLPSPRFANGPRTTTKPAR